ncbi:MAG: helix-turn-helix domain-containing protein [Mariprofundales bacterium]
MDEGVNVGSVWRDLNQQIYLGGDDFVERIKSKLHDGSDLSEVPKAQWKPSGKSLDEYEQEIGDRSEAMARAYLDGGYRMNEIARHFGVHYATVSRAVKKREGNV